MLRPEAPLLLMTPAQKQAALARAGVQGLALVRFTEALSQWEPETFVRRVLVDWLRVAEVWVGADFLFGRNRSGNFTLLRALGQQHGFRAEKIDPIRYKDFVVSSTRIRRLVSEGRVEEAGALLGRHYTIAGPVVRGAARGRDLGFPTANLATDNELLPPRLRDVRHRRRVVWPAVTNVGVRPTFGGPGRRRRVAPARRVGDLYDQPMTSASCSCLRDERRFAMARAARADCRRRAAGQAIIR